MAALLSAVWGGGEARAAAVTVGSPLTAAFTRRVVRWRVQGVGRFRLRVLRREADGSYSPVATSAATIASTPATQTQTSSVSVAAGDLVGLDSTGAGDTLGLAAIAGSTLQSWLPPLTAIAPRTPDIEDAGSEAAFNVDVLRPPVLSGVTPASGPPAGGTPVVITGSDLGEASAVNFAAGPAVSFHVDSDTQITAVTPPSSTPDLSTSSSVTVVTPAGIASGRRFSYRQPPPVVPSVVALGQLKLSRAPWATRQAVHIPLTCATLRPVLCSMRARIEALHGRPVSYGATSATLLQGESRTVVLRLNRVARARLARLRRISVRLAATGWIGGPPFAALTTRTFLIRTPRPKR